MGIEYKLTKYILPLCYYIGVPRLHFFYAKPTHSLIIRQVGTKYHTTIFYFQTCRLGIF